MIDAALFGEGREGKSMFQQFLSTNSSLSYKPMTHHLEYSLVIVINKQIKK